MKTFITLVVFTTLINTICNAQNVGIGTNTPHNSAMLDISSTNKGLLTPRMTTAQRNTIATPAKGLLVFDTDFNSFWFYNGSSWVNLSAGGGGSFSLPFEQTVNTASPSFRINNSGVGAALHGHSTNDFGVGIAGSTTAPFGWGINSFARSPLAISLYANADSATAIKAESKVGLAIEATSQQASVIKAYNANNQPTIDINNTVGTALKVNASATSAIVATTAWNGTTIAAVKATSTGVNSAGVIGENNNTTGGEGVVGISSMGIGVKGTTNGNTLNDAGVLGLGNTSGTVGVSGYAFHSASIGVLAKSDNGTALAAQSINGKALEVSGNLKISGGNTNPKDGAVLTSDAAGNARWKTSKIGFLAKGIATGYTQVNASSFKKLIFSTEEFDYGNNFETIAENADPLTSSRFTAPVDGLYHLDIGLRIYVASKLQSAHLYTYILRNGNATEAFLTTSESSDEYAAYIKESRDIKLKAGDKVYFLLLQSNDDNLAANIDADRNFDFVGMHLVFEE